MKIPSLIIVSLLGFAVLGGCASQPGPEPRWYPPPAETAAVKPPEPGAIYSAGTEIRLFEDRKASRVGDILTVVLAEKTNASKNSATSTGKSTEATLLNPTVFGRDITHNGIPLFGGELSGDSNFDGRGSSSQSNSLDGDITVTVIERLPSGNLVIAGDKWVTLNQGQEFIRVTGVIRPDDIEPDNSLLSTRIANAQITYSSKGVLAAANKMGLISRFFNSVLHPY